MAGSLTRGTYAPRFCSEHDTREVSSLSHQRRLLSFSFALSICTNRTANGLYMPDKPIYLSRALAAPRGHELTGPVRG